MGLEVPSCASPLFNDGSCGRCAVAYETGDGPRTAANAMVGVLPGGAAFAAAWAFRQLPRRGVEQVLAAASPVVSGAFAALSLFVLPSAGAFTAG